jgi:hypothetical protein
VRDFGALDSPCTQPNERLEGEAPTKKEGQDLGLPEALRKAKGGLLSASVWVSGQTDTVVGPTSACLLGPVQALLAAARGQQGRVRYPAQRP